MAVRTISGTSGIGPASAELVVELVEVLRLLEADPQPFRADVAFDERLADLLRPVRHLLCEQAAVELDEFVGQLVRERLVGVPCAVHLEQLLGHVGVVVLVLGVQQEQPGHLVRETLRVVACVEAAEGVADQQVGSGHPATRSSSRSSSVTSAEVRGSATRSLHPFRPGRRARSW